MRHFRPKSLVLFFFSVAIILACQEDEELTSEDIVDQDLESATLMADEYLSDTKGRSAAERSITVFRYKGNQVFFDTNTDDYEGYQVLTEESITAVVDFGEYVFWYSGGGMTDLDGIEFDEYSEKILVDSPTEINYDQMWVIKMPEKGEVESDGEILLKYDILYQYEGYKGAPIRLDPKIRVTQSTTDTESE